MDSGVETTQLVGAKVTPRFLKKELGREPSNGELEVSARLMPKQLAKAGEEKGMALSKILLESECDEGASSEVRKVVFEEGKSLTGPAVRVVSLSTSACGQTKTGTSTRSGRWARGR